MLILRLVRAGAQWTGRAATKAKLTVGFDYDTCASDLNALLEHLDLTGAVLGGFSMGTGDNICWTHYDEVNTALLEFLAA